LFDTYEWKSSFLFTISENQMNRYIISKEKIVPGKIGKNRDADKSRADEKLRKTCGERSKTRRSRQSGSESLEFNQGRKRNLIILITVVKREENITTAGELSDPLDWFDRYGDYLFAYARRRVREQAAAEDLVQETFLAAIQANDRFRAKARKKRG
jgi:hypothetical protein